MKLIDLQKQVATLVSTSTINLGAAVQGYRTLAQAIAAGDIALSQSGVVFFVRDPASGAFESALYFISSATSLVREKILSSSNNGNAVDFSNAACEVYSALPSAVVARMAFDQDVAFSETVPLKQVGIAWMPPTSVQSALAFSPASGSVKGAQASVILTADGTHQVSFPGFKQAWGSADYDNRNGVQNVVEFFFDGVNYWYAVMQEAAPLVVVPPTTYLRLTNLSHVTESGTGPYAYKADTSVYAQDTPGPGGVVSASFKSGQDGSIAAQISGLAAQSEMIVGLSTSANLQAFNTLAYGLYGDAFQKNYQQITNGALTAISGFSGPQEGDIIRLRRSGTSLIAEVARSNAPTQFATAYTWANVPGDAFHANVLVAKGATAYSLTGVNLA